jgi:hypothetical protein
MRARTRVLICADYPTNGDVQWISECERRARAAWRPGARHGR